MKEKRNNLVKIGKEVGIFFIFLIVSVAVATLIYTFSEVIEVGVGEILKRTK